VSNLIVSERNLNPNPGARWDMNDFAPMIAQDLHRMTGQRFDALDTAIFLRQLTEVLQQTYDVKYPELKARRLIPVDNRVGPGADSFVWRQFDKYGQAKVVQNYADDFPNTEIVGQEFQTRVLSLGASYQYTLQDLRAASMAGLPLETRKAEAARFVMERAIESIAWLGLSGSNGLIAGVATDNIPVYGLTNFPGIQSQAASVTWSASSTTVSQILGDINKLQQLIFLTTKGVHTPDTLVLPTKIYGLLATTARSPTFTDDSMLQYVLKQSPWLKSIEFSPFLDTAGGVTTAYGSGSSPRIMMYERTPEVLQLVVPQEFEQLPPQMLGMAFKIPCHMRCAGVTIRYPKAVIYMDGSDG
jgi:hypothetical protein